MLMRFVLLLLFVFFPLHGNVEAQDDLRVFARWRMYSDVSNSLYDAIAKEAYRYLDEREKNLSAISGEAGWRKYIDDVRGKLRDAFGPMPEKTPLNARVTGTFEYEGITVENILFESRPGFFVTSSMFKRSDLKGRLPAILYVCGHSRDGYKSKTYQHIAMNLARKGFAVLAMDPVGQGERYQYYDPEKGESAVGGPTSEHSYAGLQYLLIGRTMAMVRLWDGIRAVDYLCTRPDVDPERIGVQGRSGGGTMSAYLGAMEPRMAAAAPECYITSFRRLFQSIGPQDAEQNLLGQIALGLDHGDFLLARAPKPTLVVTTTRDFFSIQGARETVRSVVPAFEALGAGGNIGMIEDDATHMSTRLNRERVYAFFMRAFGVEGSSADEDIPPLEPGKLQVSETGQVITSGSRNIYDLIREDAAPVLENLGKARAAARNRIERRRRFLVEKTRSLSGYETPREAPETVFTGRFRRDGYSVEKYIIDASGDIPLPSLVFTPEGGGKHPAVLFVSSRGKEAEAGEGGLLERLALQGYVVMAVDIPGFGELKVNTRGDDSVIRGVSYNILFGAQLIGRSVTGIQAACVTRALGYMLSRDDVTGNEAVAVAWGITGPALTHAAALGGGIGAVALVESPVSWESVLDHRFYDQAVGSTIVPSALLYYDLPDLTGVLAPRPVVVIDPVGGDGKPADDALTEKVVSVAAPFYGEEREKFGIVRSGGGVSAEELLLRWLESVD